MQLHLEQTHVQKLSPMVEQSVHILQMDSQRLEAYLADAMLDNPIIEIDDSPLKSAKKLAASSVSVSYNYGFSKNRASSARTTDEMSDFIENIASPNEDDNLTNYLLSQIRCQYSGEMAQRMRYLLNFIDDNGYLKPSLEYVCGLGKYSADDLTAALHNLQSLDPPGIAASSLSECLCLQLDKDDVLARELVCNYIEEIASGQISGIADALAVSPAEIATAISRIKRLSPKPGATFCCRSAPLYIIPDIIVTKNAANKFETVLSNDACPEIRPCKAYVDMVETVSDPEVRAYLNAKIEQFNWFQKCLENRRKTMLELTQAIINSQERFFKYGASFLNVFRMKDAADLIGVHESTVSRAVNGKYLLCSHGVFPLKFFFVRSIQRDASNVSVLDAKRELSRMISEEPHCRAMSDRLIASKLCDAGITISRRTVAKYRSELGIPHASARARRFNS